MTHVVYNPGMLAATDRQKLIAEIDWDKKHTENKALGFAPLTGIERQMNAGRMLCLHDTTSDAKETCGGWLMYCRVRDELTILGISVPDDFRRQGRGKSLIDALTRDPQLKRIKNIKLRCAADLAANEFWVALGFELIETIPGRNKTGRMINVYRRERECNTSTSSISTRRCDTPSTT